MRYGLAFCLGALVVAGAWGDSSGPLKPGTYALTEVTLTEPWREEVGALSADRSAEEAAPPAEPAPKRAGKPGVTTLSGTLWELPGSPDVQVTVLLGAKPRALVAYDPKSEEEFADKPVFPAKLVGPGAAEGETRLLLPPIPGMKGAAPALEMTLDADGSSATVSSVATRALRARVPCEGGFCYVYALPHEPVAGGARASRSRTESLWLDDNHDGVRQDCEMVVVGSVGGTGGVPRELRLDRKRKVLTVRQASMPLRALDLQVLDGQDRPVVPLRVSVRGAEYIRPRGRMQVPASAPTRARRGRALPVPTADDGLTVEIGSAGGRSLSLRADRVPLHRLVVGGPVTVHADVETSEGGTLKVSVEFKTKHGQQVPGISGLAPDGGKVKVFSADGKLVQSGKMEFG